MSMPESVEITLEKPLFTRGRIVRSLKLRAPTQAEVDEACMASDYAGERGRYLVGLITGVRPKALKRLCQADQDRLGAAYEAVTGA